MIRSLSTRASCSALATKQLDLDDPLGRRGLRARLQLVDLVLGLAQQRGRPLLGLGHDPGRLLVGVAQDLRAVLAERRRERRLVDDGVGRPLLGLRDGRPELLLAAPRGPRGSRATDWR